jgi:hypothetical protein
MSKSLTILDRDLRDIFGARLQSLVQYGTRVRHAAPAAPAGGAGSHHAHAAVPAVHTLAIVETLTADDLRACSGRVPGWHRAGLATPLVLPAHEFDRSLDAFPFEFGAIVADHVVLSGTNPFNGLRVDPADLRRACEVQARSHLLHLREGYLETGGRADALAVLIVDSAPAFAALLENIARLQRRDAAPSGVAADVARLAGVTEISGAEAERIFPAYLDSVERLVKFVDGWNA